MSRQSINIFWVSPPSISPSTIASPTGIDGSFESLASSALYSPAAQAGPTFLICASSIAGPSPCGPISLRPERRFSFELRFTSIGSLPSDRFFLVVFRSSLAAVSRWPPCRAHVEGLSTPVSSPPLHHSRYAIQQSSSKHRC